MPEAVPAHGALDSAVATLRAAGVPEPRREAFRLWRELSGKEAFERAVHRRAAGEPLQYVTGVAGFRRLTLRCDRRALIPRPETEGLVDLLLARVGQGAVADVGTGSGCLALSLAQEGRFTTVIALDRSPEALALARWNAEGLALDVELVQGDLLEPLGSESLDALVSNPPYLTTGEYLGLDSAVRSWEPRDALDAGADGMLALDRLLADARRVLRPRGCMALELDARRASATAVRARELGWAEVSLHTDLFGRDRYLLARRSVRS